MLMLIEGKSYVLLTSCDFVCSRHCLLYFDTPMIHDKL
jgi:hypothetical protein